MDIILVLLAVAGTVYFLVRGAQMQTGYRAMGKLEAKRVELEAARERSEKVTYRTRMRTAVLALGYDGDAFPFVAAMAFAYLAIAVSLSAVGMAQALAYSAGLPLAGAVVWATARWQGAQRHKRFNVQLVELLELLAGQIEGGSGAQRALATVVPTMQEPLRTEMSRVLDTQMATKDLIGAMRELAQRYPSRAFSLFISALEIDQADGQAIGPALRQSADLLNGDFELRAEAGAEIAQQRGEFFIILGVMTGLGAAMILGGDKSQQEAYMSPIGIIALGLSLSNILWGAWRLMALLRNIEGDEPL